MRAIVAIVLFIALAFATASSKHAPIRKTLTSLPHGWHKAARASPKQMINVVFAVKQRNIDTLEDWVLKVSDPNSAFFGRHLSMDTVNRMTTNAAGLAKVHVFLRSAGLERTAITLFPNNFVRARMSVAMAERILSTEFHHFVHRQAKKKVLRAEAYTISNELSESVQFVSVLHFPSSRPAPMMVPLSDEAVRSLAASNFTDYPPGYTTPQVLYKYYGVSNSKVSNTKATQSLYESLDQSYSPDDLTQFQNSFNLVTNPIQKVIGPNVPGACAQDPNNCVEANLDVQYIMAIAQNSPTWFWSIASSDQHPWIDWLVAVGNDANAPLVHSVSYGDIEPMGDVDEMTRFNDEAMKLAARGITVVIASGDDGVANFIARNNASACGFTPSFPATAQYVTAVGATMGPENSTAEIAETSDAGGGITTGGGFSTVFTQPSYQSSAVNAYLQNPNVNLPPTSQFNPSGRGYPDVSMIGHNYIIYDGGQPSGGSGTSASAPVFAGMITLINADRMNAGKSPLGFLNQILYNFAVSNPNVYHDITQGTNNCCAGDPGSQVCCQYGFTATKGWDPLTGLGSIHFQAFHDACLALP